MAAPFKHTRHAPIIMIDEPGRQSLLIVVVHPVEIGRECSGVVLTDLAISRKHLLAVAHGNTVRVTDLGTTNGSTIGGVPLEPNHLLRIGQLVKFGGCTLSLVVEGSADVDVAESDTCATAGEGATIHNLRATSIDIVADSVMNDPLQPPTETDAGTVTVVFSDIEGSTMR